MAFKVIDNFLDSSSANQLKNVFLSNEFPWFLNSGINVSDEETKDISNRNLYDAQFTHTFYAKDLVMSPLFEVLTPLINRIDPICILRIKANYLPRTHKIIENDYHTDYTNDVIKCKTAVYYVNSNNGYTKFETGEIVESVENRFLIFDSDMPHAGTYCTNKIGRVVINFNFIEKASFSLLS
jgi:hypothetical protein